MGKKGKNKTAASYKKVVKTAEQLEQEREAKEEKKLLRKIFGSRKKKKEAKAAVIVEKIQAPVELKKHEPKPPKEKKPRKPLLSAEQKQKAKGAFLVLIGLFMIAFVSYFLYTRLFRPQSLAHFLPADTTIGFAEVNIDGDSNQGKNFAKLFEKYPVYQASNLVQLANLIFPVNYKTDIEPWIGRSVGVAMVKQTVDDNSVKLLMFVENKSTEKTLNFLKSRTLATSATPGDDLLSDVYKGYTIYHYKLSQNYYFAFVNNYLVLAGNGTLIQQILDAQSGSCGAITGSCGKLQEDPLFQKVNNNLPSSGLMFGYVNMQKLFETMANNPIFQGQKMHDLLALQPFLKIFAAEGFTMVATENNLTVQTFEAIDRGQLQGQSYLTYNDKYAGKLLDLAGENSILFAGGHDLMKELNRIGELFSKGTSIDATLFNGILLAQKEKYFGKDISLESDIYPLLKNEYLVTVENNFEEPTVSVFIDLTNKNEDLLRIEKLASAFINKRAIFSPHVREVTLPDGTKGREIVASAEDITRTDNTYNGNNVTTLQLGSLPWSINYTVLDNTLVIATNSTALNNIIDRKSGKLPTNLRNSTDFAKSVMPVMHTADEIFNIKLGALIPALGLDQNPVVKPYIEGFTGLTMAKNFFDDGISTLYVIDVL